jgi:hypothetical protein
MRKSSPALMPRASNPARMQQQLANWIYVHDIIVETKERPNRAPVLKL